MVNAGLVHRSCLLLGGLLALQVLGAGCIEGECPVGGDPDPDGVEEAVWAVALDQAWWSWGEYPFGVPTYLWPHTVEPWYYDRRDLRRAFPAVDPGVYEDFEEKNESSVALPSDLDTVARYPFLEPFDRWPLYGKKEYSLVAVSRVGVDQCRSRALVYWEMNCGGMCGNGNYVLAAWSDGGWTGVAEFEDWQSR